jgi:hypothetical protein
MEQRAVIHFLTLKGLRAPATGAELKKVYETETLSLSTVSKLSYVLRTGERDIPYTTTQGVENRLPTTLPRLFSLC